MKLLTVRSGHALHPAILLPGAAVLDLVAARAIIPLAGCVPDGMSALLATGEEGLALLRRLVVLATVPRTYAALQQIKAVTPFEEATLGPVVPDGNLVLSGSMNSRGHLEEMGDGPPEFPCAFHKSRSALSASGAPIDPPPGHGDMLDWEGEFCVVIGSTCHRVAVDAAMDYVAGYTLLNDISAREYVMPFVTAKGASPAAQAWERNVLGKNYPTFAPIGPVIVTRDEVADPLSYSMQTLVNGTVMQSSTQEDLVFGPAEMVAYFSQFHILAPGDIISMGSPPGVGMARKPPVWLKPGDRVEVRIDWLGTLVNVVAEPRPDA